MSVAEIMSLLDRTPLTPEEAFDIWSHLHRKSGLKRRGPQLGAACVRNHPGKPSRWVRGTKRDGDREYVTNECRECVIARAARRAGRNPAPVIVAKPRGCPQCPHSKRHHRLTDGGRCYHLDVNRQPDCDCTGGKS
jgi:hypothetical protein